MNDYKHIMHSDSQFDDQLIIDYEITQTSFQFIFVCLFGILIQSFNFIFVVERNENSFHYQ